MDLGYRGSDPEMAQGAEHLRAGRLAEAAECFRRVLARDPGSFPAYQHLGIVYARQGDLARGIEHLDRALRLDGRVPETHYHLGLLYEQQGRTADAIQHLRMALGLNPRYAAAHTALERLQPGSAPPPGPLAVEEPPADDRVSPTPRGTLPLALGIGAVLLRSADLWGLLLAVGAIVVGLREIQRQERRIGAAAVGAVLGAGVLLVGLSSLARASLSGGWKGKPAPPLSLADSQGTLRSLSEYRGNVVLLNFWAPW